MRTLFPIILIALLATCVHKVKDRQKVYHGYADDRYYYNDQVIVVEKGNNAHGNYLLVQRLTNRTQYTELNGYNWPGLKNPYGNPLYHFSNAGDTLFFKYIAKSRFWTR